MCPVPGCDGGTEVRFCNSHWALVPMAVRMPLFVAYAKGAGVGTQRYADALAAAARFVVEAESFLNAEPPRATMNEQNSRTSNVFDPDWRPGRDLRRKAIGRAAAKGETFEVALAVLIEAIRRRQITEIERVARELEADREQRQEHQLAKRAVFPPPESVYARPVAFETDRRRH